MYAGSFEPEALKKSTTKSANTVARRSGCRTEPDSPRHACAIAAGSANIHGRKPAKRIGMKYHQGSERRWTVVRKRVKCSWMKKNCANSGFAYETAMNQGAARAKK